MALNNLNAEQLRRSRRKYEQKQNENSKLKKQTAKRTNEQEGKRIHVRGTVCYAEHTMFRFGLFLSSEGCGESIESECFVLACLIE